MTHAFRNYVPLYPKPKDTPKPEAYNPAFETLRDGREICRNHPETGTMEGRREYKRRIKAMLERQNGICCLAVLLGCCAGPLRLQDATFEHELSRGMGGSRRDDRIVLPSGKWINGAACRKGNQMKGGNKLRYND
jgi:hypothetical protein